MSWLRRRRSERARRRAFKSIPLAIERGATAVVLDWCRQYPASVDHVFANGLTVLCMATLAGESNIVETLIQNGADVDLPSPRFGIPPLFYAARRGDIDCLTILIEAGANVNYVSSQTMRSLYPRAIHEASHRGSVACAKLLLEHGADVHRQGEDSPLAVACREGFTEIAELLLKHDPRYPQDDVCDIALRNLQDCMQWTVDVVNGAPVVRIPKSIDVHPTVQIHTAQNVVESCHALARRILGERRTKRLTTFLLCTQSLPRELLRIIGTELIEQDQARLVQLGQFELLESTARTAMANPSCSWSTFAPSACAPELYGRTPPDMGMMYGG